MKLRLKNTSCDLECKVSFDDREVNMLSQFDVSINDIVYDKDNNEGIVRSVKIYDYSKKNIEEVKKAYAVNLPESIGYNENISKIADVLIISCKQRFYYRCHYDVKVGDLVYVDGMYYDSYGIVKEVKNDEDIKIKQIVCAYRMIQSDIYKVYQPMYCFRFLENIRVVPEMFNPKVKGNNYDEILKNKIEMSKIYDKWLHIFPDDYTYGYDREVMDNIDRARVGSEEDMVLLIKYYQNKNDKISLKKLTYWENKVRLLHETCD